MILGAFANLRKTIASFVMSLKSFCPVRTLRFPLEGFSCNFILQTFSKICRSTSALVKNGKISGPLHADPSTFMISRRIIPERGRVSEKNF